MANTMQQNNKKNIANKVYYLAKEGFISAEISI